MKYDLTKREKKMCFAVHSVAFARDYMSGVCVFWIGHILICKS